LLDKIKTRALMIQIASWCAVNEKTLVSCTKKGQQRWTFTDFK